MSKFSAFCCFSCWSVTGMSKYTKSKNDISSQFSQCSVCLNGAVIKGQNSVILSVIYVLSLLFNGIPGA